jgi:hypothetical protein
MLFPDEVYGHAMGSVFDDALRLMTGYHEIRGRAAEIGRGQGSWIILAEHFFLGMLHDGGGKCMELPGGTGLSVSPHGDRPWLKVPGPYDTAEILNAALAALGRAGGARPLPRQRRG